MENIVSHPKYLNGSKTNMKNNSIEFLRFFFMIFMAMCHFHAINFIPNAQLVVEFYFILSGFLLYKSFVKSNIGTVTYTIKKIKRFYLEYLLVFLFMYFMQLYFMRSFFQEGFIDCIFSKVVRFLPELLLIHNVGIYEGGCNYPLWYFSVLIIGGGLLYGMLHVNRRVAINIIFPFLIMLVYTYLTREKNELENWQMAGCFYLPFFRGLAGV